MSALPTKGRTQRAPATVEPNPPVGLLQSGTTLGPGSVALRCHEAAVSDLQQPANDGQSNPSPPRCFSRPPSVRTQGDQGHTRCKAMTTMVAAHINALPALTTIARLARWPVVS